MVADVYDFAYFRQRLDLLGWGLTAAAWPIEEPRHAPALGTAAAALWSAGRLAEAADTAERSIALAGGRNAPEAALALNVSGDIAMFLGRTDDAIERYRRHGALADPTGRRVPELVTALSVAHALINGRRARRGRGSARRRGSARTAHRQPHHADLGALPHRRTGQRQRPRTGSRRIPRRGRLRHAGRLAAVRHHRPQLGRRTRRTHRRPGRGVHRTAAGPRRVAPAGQRRRRVLPRTARRGWPWPGPAPTETPRSSPGQSARTSTRCPASPWMPNASTAALTQVRARLGDTATDSALAQGEALSLPATLAAARRALAAKPAQTVAQ